MLRVAEYEAFTDTGRSRSHNEDAFFARAPVFAVADGMGGARAGEVASNAAVQTLAQGMGEDGGSAEQRLAEVVRRANERIHEMSREDETRAGMGTTMTAAHVGEDDVAVAHVGDSRAYRLRDGAFERLTEDHSLVEEMRRRGQLTAEEADEHPQRNVITRVLGVEPSVVVDTHSWRARSGDVYLLCSDGLTSMVGERRVGELVAGARSLRDVGRALIAEANAAGGRDNITVVLFRLEEVPGAAPPAGSEQPTADHEPVTVDHEPVTADHEPVTADHEPASHGRGARTRATAAGPALRRRRPLLALGVAAIVALPVLVGAYLATQAVFFVGTDRDGFVTLYRGLPWDLPLGVELYESTYTSGVRVDTLPAGRRAQLLDHRLRSKEEASADVRSLERDGAVAIG